MKETKDILPPVLEKIGHRSGETVPEGYFDSFKAQMKASLPERRWEYDDGNESHDNRSLWMKVRPYVYLAAMFMGIWCMMNLFDLTRANTEQNIDNNPTLIAAINNDQFFNDYVVGEMDNIDIYDELYDDGFDPASLDNDF